VLTTFGRRAARRQEAIGLPGNDTLAGIADPPCVADPRFFVRWLREARGQRVELCCHPGRPDPALAGRDPDPHGRRPRELELLCAPEFLGAVRGAGFRLVTAAEMAASPSGPEASSPSPLGEGAAAAGRG
jgi:hypothetical protein